MLPKISFLARMTRDPEFKTTQSGIAICKVGLACSEKYNDKETTLFISGTAFKKTAEFISTILKGQRVFVTGKIQTDTWQDQQSGQNRSQISMVIESFEYIEKKGDNSQAVNHTQHNRGGFQSPQQQQTGYQDDGLPF